MMMIMTGGGRERGRDEAVSGRGEPGAGAAAGVEGELAGHADVRLDAGSGRVARAGGDLVGH